MSIIDDLEVKKNNVDDILNNINYDFSAYVPSTAAINFVNFIKLVNGPEGEENKTPPVHYKMLDNVFSKEKRTAILCHRGIGKTTLMAEYLFLYIAFSGKLDNFGSVELAMYVADSAEGGAKNLRKNIEFRYNQSEFLQKYIPRVRFTDTRLEFENSSGHIFIVKMYGGQGNIRGTKEQGKRPQLVVMDDLMSDQDAKSPTVIENVNNNIHKAIAKALHPKRSKTIYLGTPFNRNDPLYTVVESGAWNVSVYPICEKFPCTREEFKGSWEDRFPYDYVLEEYKSAIAAGIPMAFSQELMLRVISEEDKLVSDTDIEWYELSTMKKHKSKYNFYITTDFATSERASADFSVISVWAYNNNGDWLYVDGICKRQDMGKNVDDLFRLVSIYKPLGVGLEVSGQQGGFIPWLKREMLSRNVFFNLAKDHASNKEGIRPNTSKLVRFMTVLPLIKQHKLWFPIELKNDERILEALDELGNVSSTGFKSKHDDFVDTISMLMALKPVKPGEEINYSKHTKNSMNIWSEFVDPDDEVGPRDHLIF
jgi:phage terminase large subunit-like protein